MVVLFLEEAANKAKRLAIRLLDYAKDEQKTAANI